MGYGVPYKTKNIWYQSYTFLNVVNSSLSTNLLKKCVIIYMHCYLKVHHVL